MNPDIYEKLQIQWKRFKANIEVAEMAFLILRIIILWGGIFWLVFSHISEETFQQVSSLLFFFIAYSVLIFLWLFFSIEKEKIIYGFFLFFDFLFVLLLVRATGGIESPFLNGFYLLTALYSFYYGLITGALIATVAAFVYLISGGYNLHELHWADFTVRVAFLFLLALPIGMLSQKLKKDNDKIENLNRDLQGYIEELQKTQRKLIHVEKLTELGRLTADVAHEIRNPLTSIGGFARRLNNKLALDSREKEYAEIVIAEVNRLERILRDVLMFSRETRSNSDFQEINSPVKESLRTYADMCREQSICVQEDLDTSLPRVFIDRDQVREAVGNLISNAMDAMPKGGTLRVRTFMKELYDVKYVAVEVADAGLGISKEKLNVIFEPFYSTKEIGTGTGLGLSICKKIVDEHNGLIIAESELNEGTTFTLFFPHQPKEEGKKITCWEFNRCGVEKAEGAVEMRCPAYPHYGRICWTIAGTFCGKRVSGAIAQKLGDCRKCGFYQKVVVLKEI